jgi:zinc-ribbon domain
MIGILPVPDSVIPDVFTESLLLPVPGPDKNQVQLEPRDGSNVVTVNASTIQVLQNGRQVMRAHKVKVTIFITDSRIAWACSNYDKGGGWVGSAGAMIVLNAASKALAAVRRHGKMLVGQVRYPWVAAVGGSAKQGVLSSEVLVLRAKPDKDTVLEISLTLPSDLDALSMAADIARRAAAYRLACAVPSDAEATSWLQPLTQVQPLAPGPKGSIQWIQFNDYFFANDQSARYVPQGMSVPAAPTPPPASMAANFCVACGSPLSSDDVFCTSCGKAR